MVNDLLDVARIEAYQLELAHIPFSVVSETHKVIDMLRSHAGNLGFLKHHINHTHDRRPTFSLWAVCTAKKQVEVTAVVDVARPQRVGDPGRYGRYRLPLLLLVHHLA